MASRSSTRGWKRLQPPGAGRIGHYATGGERDFSASSDTRADHYEVQVEDGYAAEAQRVLSTMPAT